MRMHAWGLVLALFCFAIPGFSKNQFRLNGELVLEECGEADIEYVFFNDSEREVEAFSLIFFVFDEEGNSILKNHNYEVERIEERVAAKSYFYGSLPVTKLLSYLPEDSLELEWFYVTAIKYADGEEIKVEF